MTSAGEQCCACSLNLIGMQSGAMPTWHAQEQCLHLVKDTFQVYAVKANCHSILHASEAQACHMLAGEAGG